MYLTSDKSACDYAVKWSSVGCQQRVRCFISNSNGIAVGLYVSEEYT